MLLKDPLHLALGEIFQLNWIQLSAQIIDFTGDHITAIYLTEVARESEKAENGWFPRTREEWFEKTRITERQLRRCHETMRPFGVVVKRLGLPGKNYYSIDREKLVNMLIEKYGDLL